VAGGVLTSDAAGVASWQLPASSYFQVRGLKDNANLAYTKDITYFKVLFNFNTTYNTNLHYDFTTSTYNAPKKGLYHFNVLLGSGTAPDVILSFVRLIRSRNGVTAVVAESVGTSNSASLSVDIDLEPLDQVWVEARNNAGYVEGGSYTTYYILSLNHRTLFSGYLIHPL
jgi:hypothetical protein